MEEHHQPDKLAISTSGTGADMKRVAIISAIITGLFAILGTVLYFTELDALSYCIGAYVFFMSALAAMVADSTGKKLNGFVIFFRLVVLTTTAAVASAIWIWWTFSIDTPGFWAMVIVLVCFLGLYVLVKSLTAESPKPK